MKEKRKLLNNEIKSHHVKLISDNGEVFGEMSLQKAKEMANEKEMDLMQLSMEGDIAVVKMMDYGKFLYKQKKQEQKNKQKGKNPDLKTLKITFKIGEHDLEVKKNQAEKFAKDGHPLKIMLTLRGRENQYEDIAKQKMESFVSSLENFYKVDKKIVKSGNNYIVMVLPK